MNTEFLSVAGPLFITAAVALGGLYKYVVNRERQAVVRSALVEVVDALGADDDVHRRAGAIMLRRFFDENTEQGGKDTPYAGVALNVIAATLRDIETDSFQKLLADGLAYAPTLRGADLQKTNLQGAYLGRRAGSSADLRDADFYRADLTSASLKDVDARGAVFYQARLTNTVFKGADLRGANFFEATLRGAKFDDAKLDGAVFTNARDIDPGLQKNLDEHGVFFADRQGTRWTEPGKPKVFLSRPGSADINTRRRVWALADRIRDAGFDVLEIDPASYAASGAMTDVRRVMSGCAGVAVVAVPDLAIKSAFWREATPQAREMTNESLTTPWTCLELGMAVGLGLPSLVAIADGVSDSIFDFGSRESSLFIVSLREDHLSRAFTEQLDDWSGSVREQMACQSKVVEDAASPDHT